MVNVNEPAIKQDGCVFRQTFNSRRAIEDAGGTIISCAVNAGTSLMVDPVINGNFEGAAGPASWIQQNCTMSREAGTRTGGTGSYVMQVLYSAFASGLGYQACLTVGVTYRFQGWARGDGTAAPKIYAGGTTVWLGTSSTTWQSFDSTVVCTTNGNLALACDLFAAGQYVQFDDITVMPLIGGGVGAGISAKTPAGRITYDKTSDLLANSTQMTIRMKVRLPSVRTDSIWIEKANSGWTSLHWAIELTAAGYFVCYIADGALQPYFLLNTALPAAIEVTIHAVFDGSLAAGSRGKWYRNGALNSTTISGTLPTSLIGYGALQPIVIFNRGGGTGSSPESDAIFYDCTIWNRALSDEEILDDYQGDTYSETIVCTNAGCGLIDLPLQNYYLEEDASRSTLVDGNMESVGVAAWTVANNANLTKEVTSPPQGTQWLKIAYIDTANPQARQAILTIGGRYKVTGYARSDGAATTGIIYLGTTKLWESTTSASWQAFDAAGECAGSTNFILNSGTAVAGYTGFDSITIYPYINRTKNLGSLSRYVQCGDGITPATLPTMTGRGKRGMTFVQASAQRLEQTISVDPAIGNMTIITFVVCNSPLDGAATNNYSLASNWTPTTSGWMWRVLNGSAGVAGQLQFVSSSAGVDSALASATGTIKPYQPIVLAVTKSGTNFAQYVNGVQTGVTTALTQSVARTGTLSIGGGGTATPTQNWNGQMYNFAIFPYALTASQIKSIGERWRSQLNMY